MIMAKMSTLGLRAEIKFHCLIKNLAIKIFKSLTTTKS